MLEKAKSDKLKTVFSDYPEIEAVYLFDSAASGEKAEPEDIDIGIVSSDFSLTEKRIDLLADLVKKRFDNIDITFFNSADLVLQFEIIHHNKLIYRIEEFNHGELFSNTIRKYFDFEPYLKRQRKKMKERILKNG